MDWQTGKKGIGSKEDLGGENVDKEQVALYSLQTVVWEMIWETLTVVEMKMTV